MPRSHMLAMPLLGCLVSAFLVGSAHAQSTSFMYVGADVNQTNKAFGSALLTSTGAIASGQFVFINADPTTTNYKGLSTFSNSQLAITGGSFQQLLAADSSSINLIGSNFFESSTFQISPTGDAFYTITGLLQQGTVPFSAQYYAPSTGTLLFNGIPAIPGAAAVPEVPTTISFGMLMMLGSAWLIVKRRRITA